jgi:tetratricopeptide (TPR) repeat protein
MQSFFFGLGQEWTKAWLYAKKNYEIQLKINGKNSPLFRESIENLADIAPHLEKYDVALKLYEVLLEYNQMKYGEISSSSLHFIYKISHCHNKLGNFEKARQILERVIEVAEKELNEDNARILDLLFLLAETYRKLKKTDLYVLILDKLAQRISNIQEPSIFETYSSRLFVFYDKLDGFQKEALEQAQKCYEHCKKTYGKKHPSTIFNLIMIAKVLSELEEYKKASLLANEAIALGKEILGDDNPCLEPFLEFKKVLDKMI